MKKHIRRGFRPNEKHVRITVSLVIAGLLLLGCKNATPPDDNDSSDYDPRNITRIDIHIEAQPDIAIDSQGKAHIVYHGSRYENPRNIYYIHQNEAMEWSEPVRLSDSISHDSRVPEIVVDSQDNLHVIWEGENLQTHYTMKHEGDSWTTPEAISSPQTVQPHIEIDASDRLHVIADRNVGRYRQKSGDVWGAEETLNHSLVNPVLAVSPNGTVHIVYETLTQQIAYLERLSDGTWQDREVLSEEPGHPWAASITVGPAGTVYAAWTVAFTDQIKLRWCPPDGAWSATDSIPNMTGDPWISRMVADTSGLHIVWNAHTGQWDYDIYYQPRQENGRWEVRSQLSQTVHPSMDPSLVMRNDIIHLVWMELLDDSQRGNMDIYYMTLDVQ